jgi:hypothetical protein
LMSWAVDVAISVCADAESSAAKQSGRKVDGSVLVNQLYYRGWQSRFSWGVGTGIERNISTPLAVRFNVDYLRTRFVSSTGTLEPQNDIRLIGSLVFRSAARRPKRRLAARQP